MVRLVGPHEVARQVDAWLDERRTRLGKPPDLAWPSASCFPEPLSGCTICAWPNLGSAALVSTIGKSGRTRKHMITTKCVCAVMLTETRDALHGAQIPETPGHWANKAFSSKAFRLDSRDHRVVLQPTPRF
jgi:hypothetical protein